MTILLGSPFTAIRAVTPIGEPFRGRTSTSRSRMLDTYATAFGSLPAIATQNGYSPPGMPLAAEIMLLPGRKSILAVAAVPPLYVQAPYPPVRIEIESL